MPDSNDHIIHNDPRSQEPSYNEVTDRTKVELPLYSTSHGGHATAVSPYVLAQSVWTPVTGKRYVVTDLLFNAITHGRVSIYDGATGPDLPLAQFVLASGATVSHTFTSPYPGSAINTSLKMDCFPGCSGYLAVWGYEI